MKVYIKEFNVGMELKTKGVELEVRTPRGVHLGDFIVTKTGVEWCEGRICAGNGIKKSWSELISLLNSTSNP